MKRWCTLFLFFFFVQVWAQDPSIIYLTWKGDPATTMTVVWHVVGENGPTKVYYKSLDETQWSSAAGEAMKLIQSPIRVHQVELQNLKPATDYLFYLEGGEFHRFRTLPPNLDTPLKIAIGGDAYFTRDLYEKMNQYVASTSPDFVIMAGDISYAEGLSCALRPRSWKIQRWEDFFEIWTKEMITKEGRMIPLMTVLGNHDVKEGFDCPYKEQVFYYAFFPLAQKGIPYRLFKVGGALCFYLLDSGHSYPIGGAQAEWLEKTLKEGQEALFHIPVYHIAAYPSEVAFTHRGSKDIRKFWVPLFEKYGVKVSMEHDNHTFKKTYPLWEGKIAEGGILYLGDGAWGVPPLKPKSRWYLAKALQTNCFWLLTIDKEKGLFQAFNNEGLLLDSAEIIPKPLLRDSL